MRAAQFQAARRAATSFLIVAGLRRPAAILLLRPGLDVRLQVGQGEGLDGEGFADDCARNARAARGGLQAGRLERAVPVGLEVSLHELPEAELRREGLVGLRHAAVVQDEVLDLDAGRDADELLLDP